MVAGKEAQLFDEQALTAMFEHSGGVPRLINIIAGNALVEEFDKGVDIIGQDSRELCQGPLKNNCKLKIGNLETGECKMNVNVRHDPDLRSTMEQ